MLIAAGRLFFCSVILGVAGACDSQVPAGGAIALDSDINVVQESNAPITLSKTRCNYRSDPRVQYRCFRAERMDASTHRYRVVILSLRSTPATISEQSVAASEKLTKQNTSYSKAFSETSPHTRLEDKQALLIIPGGPGQGGMTDQSWIEYWSDFIVSHQVPYDVIVYDPPATRGSSAHWRCESFDKLALKLTGQELSVREEYAASDAVLRQCLDTYDQHLRSTNFSKLGLLSLSTQAYRERLSVLLAALPYQRYHLYGASYGTRVALMLARDSRVATLTLDSVYPFAYGTLLDQSRLHAHARGLHRGQFAELSGSTQAYDKVFDIARVALEKQTQFFRLTRWSDQSTIRFALTADRLDELAFFALYDQSMLVPFYHGISDVQANKTSFKALLERYINSVFDKDFNPLAYLATECSDNGRVSAQQLEKQANLFVDSGFDWQMELDYDICAHPIFESASPINQHPYVDKPTLIFAGALDPVTPLYWAQHLEKTLSKARLIMVPRAGHTPLSDSDCDLQALLRFWQSAEVSADFGCLQNHQQDQNN